MKLNVKWETCGDSNAWCNLNLISFSSPSFYNEQEGGTVDGVYIIWDEKKKQVVRVGSGNLQDRIQKHSKEDWARNNTNLKVTFIRIDDENIMLGVENYLGYVFEQPTIGERFPDVTPVGINLPHNGIVAVNREYPNHGDFEYNMKESLYISSYENWANKRGRQI